MIRERGPRITRSKQLAAKAIANARAPLGSGSKAVRDFVTDEDGSQDGDQNSEGANHNCANDHDPRLPVLVSPRQLLH